MTACASVLITFLAAAPATQTLETARASVKGLQYAAALKDIKFVEKTPGLTRAQVLELYELKGIAAASLNDGVEAQKAFEVLLALDPNANLHGKYSPRVMTPFFEARSAIKEQGAINIAVTADIAGDTVKSLDFTRSGLGNQLISALRVKVRQGAGNWKTIDAKWQGDKAQVPVGAPAVDVIFIGVTDQDWQVYLMQDVKHFEAQPPATTASTGGEEEPAPPPKKTVKSSAPPEAVQRGPAAEEPKYRPVAWTLFGVGAVSVGVGAALLGSAAGAKSRYDQATTNEQGVVTGLTRADALAIAADIQTQNTVGVALLAVGAGAVAGGVVTWIVGTPSKSSVAIVPTREGAFLAISGEF